MKRLIWVAALMLFIAAIALAVIGACVDKVYAQSLMGNAATELLGLAATLLLVNYYFGRSEKAEAAAPLVKLIEPALREIHNELFISHWNTHFGIDEGKRLLDVYQKNGRNPKAFSPAQRDAIHAAIIVKKDDLLRVYDVLIDQFRELSMITGWSFDPHVTAAALEARLNFIKFKSLHTATDPDSKSQLVEAYLDGEAAASAVYEQLVTRLGLSKEDWATDVSPT